jgi:hypothetical protein
MPTAAKLCRRAIERRPAGDRAQSEGNPSDVTGLTPVTQSRDAKFLQTGQFKLELTGQKICFLRR